MGRAPSTPESVDLLLALMILDKESMGRYKLAKYLRLSNAKTRAILEFLSICNLADSQRGRSGTRLKDEGRQLLHQVKNYLYIDWRATTFEIEHPDKFVLDEYFVVLYMKVSNPNISGMYERDLAIRAGASAAIILVKSNMQWIYPGRDSLVPPEISFLRQNITSPYNLLVFSFGDSQGAAYSGLTRIIQYHCSEVLELLANLD